MSFFGNEGDVSMEGKAKTKLQGTTLIMSKDDIIAYNQRWVVI